MKSYIGKEVIENLIRQAKIDNIQKIVVRAVIKKNNKFLLLERNPDDFLGGLLILPGGSVDEKEELLQALKREIKEETNLEISEVVSYLNSFDCISSSGKKIRQFSFFVKTEQGKIKLDLLENINYFLINPSDKQFLELNISDNTRKILSSL